MELLKDTKGTSSQRSLKKNFPLSAMELKQREYPSEVPSSFEQSTYHGGIFSSEDQELLDFYRTSELESTSERLELGFGYDFSKNEIISDDYIFRAQAYFKESHIYQGSDVQKELMNIRDFYETKIRKKNYLIKELKHKSKDLAKQNEDLERVYTTQRLNLEAEVRKFQEKNEFSNKILITLQDRNGELEAEISSLRQQLSLEQIKNLDPNIHHSHSEIESVVSENEQLKKQIDSLIRALGRSPGQPKKPPISPPITQTGLHHSLTGEKMNLRKSCERTQFIERRPATSRKDTNNSQNVSNALVWDDSPRSSSASRYMEKKLIDLEYEKNRIEREISCTHQNPHRTSEGRWKKQVEELNTVAYNIKTLKSKLKAH